MSNNQTLSLFRSLIQSKRFDQGTLRVLDSILINRDVKSMLNVRKSLVEYMRCESVNVIRQVVDKTVEEKLLIVEFFVKAFAVIGDMESCLALRYEALVMRELNSVSDHQLHVSYEEWFTFAEHTLENRFYVIARKACEKALGCFQMDDMLKTKDTETLHEQTEAIRRINTLKDIAMVRAASQSGLSLILMHDFLLTRLFSQMMTSSISKYVIQFHLVVFKGILWFRHRRLSSGHMAPKNPLFCIGNYNLLLFRQMEFSVLAWFGAIEKKSKNGPNYPKPKTN
nr:hypothetical protein [Tanacetum cinerariifolium]